MSEDKVLSERFFSAIDEYGITHIVKKVTKENDLGTVWSSYERFGTGTRYADGYPFKSLTELTFHPKGEGVWIEDDLVKEFLSFADSVKQIILPGVISDQTQIVKIANRLLAQLTPSAEGGADATPFGDERDLVSKSPAKVAIELTEDERTKPVTLFINDYSPPLSARPAKVTIELTEEEAKLVGDFLDRYTQGRGGKEATQLRMIGQFIFKQLPKPPLTPAPMPEQKEPTSGPQGFTQKCCACNKDYCTHGDLEGHVICGIHTGENRIGTILTSVESESEKFFRHLNNGEVVLEPQKAEKQTDNNLWSPAYRITITEGEGKK